MPRPRTHDDALAARLLTEATAVVAAGGADALTVRDVAARAGTSASAVYALYGSRDGLLRAAADAALAGFTDRLAAAPTSADASADLVRLGLAYREFALAAPDAYRVMFGPRGELAAPAAGDDGSVAPFARLRHAVARVVAAGGPGSPAPDAGLDADRPLDEPGAQAAALGLWALVHGAVSLELAGLLPGDAATRAQRYERLLRAAGPGLVRDA